MPPKAIYEGICVKTLAICWASFYMKRACFLWKGFFILANIPSNISKTFLLTNPHYTSKYLSIYLSSRGLLLREEK